MQQYSLDTGKMFSPLQIGYVTDLTEPINAVISLDWVFEQFEENPNLDAIPVERDGVILGVLTRQKANKIGASIWKKFWEKDLDAYMVPITDFIDATSYINKVLENTLKYDAYEAVWYAVQYRQNYMGVISFKKILEYTNTLRTQDLLRASEMQQHLLQRSSVKDKRFSICLFNHMAHELGGDFYRIYQPSKDQIMVGCFDVAGKNISAAFASMALGTCFSTFDLFQYASTPDKVTTRVNALIKDVSPAGIFVAGVLFYIDFTIKQIRIHNCGFSPVLAFVPQADKKISYKIFNPTLPPLGIKEEYDFSDCHTIPISRGLRICAYSDGLTDMINVYGERYEEEKATRLIKDLHLVPHSEIKKVINKEINDWVGSAALADDVTLVDIRFN